MDKAQLEVFRLMLQGFVELINMNPEKILQVPEIHKDLTGILEKMLQITEYVFAMSEEDL